MLHASLLPIIDALRNFNNAYECKDAGRLNPPEFKKDHFEKWRFDVDTLLEATSLSNIVNDMMNIPVGPIPRIFRLKTNVNQRERGGVNNRVYIFEMSIDNGVTWIEKPLSKKQVAQFLAISITMKTGKMHEHAEDLLFKNGARLIPEILMALDRHYGRNKTADTMTVIIDFYKDKKDSTIKMSDFIAKKYHQATKLRMSQFPTDLQFENAMATAILMNLNDKYAQIASEIRANLPNSWRIIEERLLDYERMLSSEKKTEIHGKIYSAKTDSEGNLNSNANGGSSKKKQGSENSKQTNKIKNQQEALKALSDKVAVLTATNVKSTKGKGKPGNFSGKNSNFSSNLPECWNCGKKGHINRDCWAKGKGKGTGKGKNSQKDNPY
jgi:Tfp pilus assembly major pilin PilA